MPRRGCTTVEAPTANYHQGKRVPTIADPGAGPSPDRYADRYPGSSLYKRKFRLTLLEIMLPLTFAAAIVAESALVRAGIATALASSPALQVVAEATPEEAGSLGKAGLDLVVCDVADRSGDQELPATPPGIPVLALVGTPETGRSLMLAGAKGVIARDASPSRLTAASLAVASGLCALDQTSLAGLLVPVAPTPPPAGSLTPREREVLELLAEGLSNKVVALRLDISEHTAKFHVNSILGKLEADTRTDAVVRAAKRGLITL